MQLPQWLQSFRRWLNKSFEQERDTGRTCPVCGGRIVGVLQWHGEAEYCEKCGRIDQFY